MGRGPRQLNYFTFFFFLFTTLSQIYQIWRSTRTSRGSLAGHVLARPAERASQGSNFGTLLSAPTVWLRATKLKRSDNPDTTFGIDRNRTKAPRQLLSLPCY